jgi:V8-like Glu-specific endopeptidase
MSAVFAFSSAAFAFPLPQPGMTSVPFSENFTQDFNFEGIVSLSNCSGSLVRFETSKDTDQAMVLTNGHCREYGFPAPGQHVYREGSSRRFGLMNAGGDTVGRLNATMIIYSTMTGTDMTLYKLRETYAQILQNYRVRPLTLQSTKPAIGTQIEVISGYWNRGYRCAIEAFVHELREDVYSMTDSIRYSRPGCDVIGGTSGSPVIAKGTRTVIGVNNTGNESGRRCTMNNPCEVDEHGGITAVAGYSYAQETYWVYSCLNAQNEVDLSVPGCLLP